MFGDIHTIIRGMVLLSDIHGILIIMIRSGDITDITDHIIIDHIIAIIMDGVIIIMVFIIHIIILAIIHTIIIPIMEDIIHWVLPELREEEQMVFVLHHPKDVWLPVDVQIQEALLDHHQLLQDLVHLHHQQDRMVRR